jgi:hypothetical protein
MQMLDDPMLQDPTSPVAKKFRQRFRVPYPIFVDLLAKAVNLGFELCPVNHAGTEGVPLEVKLLGFLRILGRGTCFDGISELSNASIEVHRSFFHDFTRKFVDRYVSIPSSPEQIRKVMSIYDRMGIPGATGSTDCVHVKWEMCPVGLKNYCNGKEGYPTLAWQCTVDHHKRFLHVTNCFYGNTNDKTICKYDSFISKLRYKNDPVFRNCKFVLYDENGNQYEETDPFLISDNGFMKWSCLICPFKIYSLASEVFWSKHLESVRKDVECAFGILKGRFTCLKLGLLLHNIDDVNYLFKACVMLHNMLLEFDGLDARWENDVAWNGVDGQHEIDDWNQAQMTVLFRRSFNALTDWSYVATNRTFHNNEDEEEEEEFVNLRRKLVNHFYYKLCHRRNELEWLN